jgi:hypothetical protein
LAHLLGECRGHDVSEQTRVVDAQLPGGGTISVRAVSLGGAQDVGALEALDFKDVTATIERVAEAIGGALKQASPQKASVSFGIEVALKAGKLTSLLVEGHGKATLDITLEWGG